jgi:hypothetical protein
VPFDRLTDGFLQIGLLADGGHDSRNFSRTVRPVMIPVMDASMV